MGYKGGGGENTVNTESWKYSGESEFWNALGKKIICLCRVFFFFLGRPSLFTPKPFLLSMLADCYRPIHHWHEKKLKKMKGGSGFRSNLLVFWWLHSFFSAMVLDWFRPFEGKNCSIFFFFFLPMAEWVGPVLYWHRKIQNKKTKSDQIFATSIKKSHTSLWKNVFVKHCRCSITICWNAWICVLGFRYLLILPVNIPNSSNI